MDKPYLKLLKKSQDQLDALILIDGYLSEKKQTQDIEKWSWIIQNSGWKGSIYYLWWDASHRTTRKNSQALITLGVSEFLNWEKHEDRAKRVGENLLPKLLSTIPEKSINFIAYSLGARIAYYCALQASSLSKIANIIMLAGAIRRNKNWNNVLDNIDNKLINIYNLEDIVLNRLFKIVSINSSPCGMKPIKINHSRLINIDATDLIKSKNHSSSKYQHILENVIRTYL